MTLYDIDQQDDVDLIHFTIHVAASSLVLETGEKGEASEVR